MHETAKGGKIMTTFHTVDVGGLKVYRQVGRPVAVAFGGIPPTVLFRDPSDGRGHDVRGRRLPESAGIPHWHAQLLVRFLPLAPFGLIGYAYSRVGVQVHPW
jgi:hypothetical protein